MSKVKIPPHWPLFQAHASGLRQFSGLFLGQALRGSLQLELSLGIEARKKRFRDGDAGLRDDNRQR